MTYFVRLLLLPSNLACQAWTCKEGLCSQYSTIDAFHPSETENVFASCSQRLVDLKCFRKPCNYGYIGDMCEVELFRNNTEFFVDGEDGEAVPDATTMELCAKACAL